MFNINDYTLHRVDLLARGALSKRNRRWRLCLFWRAGPGVKLIASGKVIEPPAPNGRVFASRRSW